VYVYLCVYLCVPVYTNGPSSCLGPITLINKTRMAHTSLRILQMRQCVEITSAHIAYVLLRATHRRTRSHTLTHTHMHTHTHDIRACVPCIHTDIHNECGAWPGAFEHTIEGTVCWPLPQFSLLRWWKGVCSVYVYVCMCTRACVRFVPVRFLLQKEASCLRVCTDSGANSLDYLLGQLCNIKERTVDSAYLWCAKSSPSHLYTFAMPVEGNQIWADPFFAAQIMKIRSMCRVSCTV